MTDESPETTLPKDAWKKDGELCLSMARRIMRELHGEMEDDFPDDHDGQGSRKARMDWLYGSKESITSAVVIVSTLMMKLHDFDRKQQAFTGDGEGMSPADHGALGQEDIAILQHYIQRTGVHGGSAD